jgi:glycosyltransferase involved in cell wall biosynthesis
MYTPVVSSELADYWRNKFAGCDIRVVSIGQIRADKNLPMLVEASKISRVGLLIMGPDAGSLADVERSITRLEAVSVEVLAGYHPIEDLAAVVALSSAVALPYSVASQSGVAALARAYGTPVIGYGTGGLVEQADVVVDSLEAADWAEAISRFAEKRFDRRIADPSGPTPAEVRQLLNVLRPVL